MKKALIICLLLTLLGCDGKKNQGHIAKVSHKVDSDSLKREQQRYTIITEAKEADLESKGGKIFWHPSEEQFNEILSIARQSIKEKEDSYPDHLKADSLESFYKQFVFFINAKGDSIAYLNSFCQEPEDLPQIASTRNSKYKIRRNWHYRIIIPHDGGDCNWRMYINFTQEKVQDIFVNGSA